MIFNCLVGNNDAHGKNFSLLYRNIGAEQEITLAPLYDLVSTVVYPDLTTRTAMSIDGARDLSEIDSGAWSRLAKQVGVRPSFATDTVRRVATKAAAAARRIAEEEANEVAHQIATRVAALAATIEQAGASQFFQFQQGLGDRRLC